MLFRSLGTRGSVQPCLGTSTLESCPASESVKRPGSLLSQRLGLYGVIWRGSSLRVPPDPASGGGRAGCSSRLFLCMFKVCDHGGDCECVCPSLGGSSDEGMLAGD